MTGDGGFVVLFSFLRCCVPSVLHRFEVRGELCDRGTSAFPTARESKIPFYHEKIMDEKSLFYLRGPKRLRFGLQK
jgi:hypothetical protein